MSGEIYWIRQVGSGQLGIIARPRGRDWLDDDVRFLGRSGVNVVVSLLTHVEATELGLEQEGEACQRNDIVYVSFPVFDRSVPQSKSDATAIVDELRRHLANGENVVAHCRASVGRASLLAACVLVDHGMTADAALDQIASARGCAVPDTEEQRRWVAEFERYLRATGGEDWSLPGD